MPEGNALPTLKIRKLSERNLWFAILSNSRIDMQQTCFTYAATCIAASNSYWLGRCSVVRCNPPQYA